MCGIVAYIGTRSASPILLDGLRRLEYRGYDSAGVVVCTEDGIGLHRERSVGPIASLEPRAASLPAARVGIGHTRWATHGPPTEHNAHPHIDCSKRIAVVHNGIIENYAALKRELEENGHLFSSQTDTEVLAHLIEDGRKLDIPLAEAVRDALRRVQGTYGVAVIDAQAPQELVVARLGSPMAVGLGDNEYIIASDPSAILSHTRQVIFLDDYELVSFSPQGMKIHSLKTAELLTKSPQNIEWSLEDVQKNGHAHFMLKEVMEEPDVLRNSMRGRLSVEHATAVLGGLKDVLPRLKTIERLILVGCGTAYYAGCFGKYILEEWAGIPTDIEVASEFRYRDPVVSKNTAIVAISQSGETADTLAALREGKMKGALALGIVNAVGSTIARETEAGIYSHAGPEISVASTKAFVSQCTVISLLALLLGRYRHLSHTDGGRIVSALQELPSLVEELLQGAESIMQTARGYAAYKDMIFLGRKYHAPIAYEGALKLKEVSYIHAEGYPSGEIKHGPLALVDETMPVTVLCPKDSVFEKTLSNIQELRARGGKVLAITTPDGEEALRPHVSDLITIPKTLEALQPILSVIPLQLMAYAIAVERGLNPDRPRNLAKSVTVE